MADQILTMLIDEKKKISEIKRAIPGLKLVGKLAARVSSSGHKRKTPPAIEI